MGDEMIREIQKTQNIDTGLILMKFLSKSKDKDIFEIKCDFVYNSGGKPYIIEEFESTYINIVDLPKYIGEIMSCENETNSLKISEEDIERLAESIEVQSKGKIRWADLISEVRANNCEKFELEDRVFYTLFTCFDDNDNVVSQKRYGIINELPQKVYEAVYPFKSETFKAEDF
ncbi:MAG: hypothetical protein UH542_01545 [Bacteroidales bacterium]|nr:hypothetical protein [Bacteroidales bacterium]